LSPRDRERVQDDVTRSDPKYPALSLRIHGQRCQGRGIDRQRLVQPERGAAQRNGRAVQRPGERHLHSQIACPRVINRLPQRGLVVEHVNRITGRSHHHRRQLAAGGQLAAKLESTAVHTLAEDPGVAVTIKGKRFIGHAVLVQILGVQRKRSVVAVANREAVIRQVQIAVVVVGRFVHSDGRRIVPPAVPAVRRIAHKTRINSDQVPGASHASGSSQLPTAVLPEN